MESMKEGCKKKVGSGRGGGGRIKKGGVRQKCGVRYRRGWNGLMLMIQFKYDTL